MPKRSAGIVMFRRSSGGIEVFLVHPGGPFWARRDEGAWSIPKGEYGEGEDALDAAVREFEEETGTRPSGTFVPLGSVRERSGKVVTAWAVEGDLDAQALRSNPFTLEWPPRSGKMREFPEVDRGAWFGLEQARRKILPGLRELLERLVETG